MRKLMLVFLGKFENCGIKIARVNSIRITKSINILSFCMVLGVTCDVDIFKLTASAQSINSESLCTVLLLKYFLFNYKNKISFRFEDLLLVS